MKVFAVRYLFFLLLLGIVGCQSVVPRSFEGTLESEAMGKPMAFSVYTPPDFSKDEQLPLVVLLHGAGGDHLDFDRYELDQHFNKAYAKGMFPRVVVTMPDGELGFWENWADGSRLYRDWVMRELLPYVQREFNTASCPESCHVMGVSMGGHGALRFSYYEADSFSTVTVISAPILSHDAAREQFGGLIGWLIPYQRIWGDIDDPNALPRAVDPFVGWIENDNLREKKLFLAWGTGDSTQIKASNELFSNRLEESGLQFTSEVYEGDHKWVDWKFVIERAVQQNAAPGSD